MDWYLAVALLLGGILIGVAFSALVVYVSLLRRNEQALRCASRVIQLMRLPMVDSSYLGFDMSKDMKEAARIYYVRGVNDSLSIMGEYYPVEKKLFTRKDLKPFEVPEAQIKP